MNDIPVFIREATARWREGAVHTAATGPRPAACRPGGNKPGCHTFLCEELGHGSQDSLRCASRTGTAVHGDGHSMLGAAARDLGETLGDAERCDDSLEAKKIL